MIPFEETVLYWIPLPSILPKHVHCSPMWKESRCFEVFVLSLNWSPHVGLFLSFSRHILNFILNTFQIFFFCRAEFFLIKRECVYASYCHKSVKLLIALQCSLEQQSCILIDLHVHWPRLPLAGWPCRFLLFSLTLGICCVQLCSINMSFSWDQQA